MPSENSTSFIRKVLYAVMMLAIFLALFGGWNVPSASASVSVAETLAGVTVSVNADQESFGATDAVILHVTFTNSNSFPVKILSWLTPLNGVQGPLFTVTHDGEAVAYLGMVAKRAAPTEADYIVLNAGVSQSADVDLSAYYDLSTTGTYEIRYEVASTDLFLNKASAQLTSNLLNLSITGRANPERKELQPQFVSGTNSFVSCNGTQQTALIAARNAASTYAANAVSYFSSNKQGARYTWWFGIFDATRYSTVSSHFTNLLNAVDTATPMTFDCGCPLYPSPNTYYAYVYPSSPYNVYLCDAFWPAPTVGTDSKAGTLIHEISHFAVVAGTDDWAYGKTLAHNLAGSNPANAIMNADSHEYFAENAPMLDNFTVNTSADTNDGSCDVLGQGTGNLDCTLREAITAANAVSDADNITFVSNYTITLTSQLPAVTSPITITGNGAANTIIQANGSPNTANYRLLQVANTGNLTLDQMTLRNGRCNGSCATDTTSGGGIYNLGSLTVKNSTLSNNAASNLGGGISNSGTLVVDQSTFSGSSTVLSDGGSAIVNQTGTATITRSTFISNYTNNAGGAIINYATLNIGNSTFFGNVSNGNVGGSIYNNGTLNVYNSTISNNYSAFNGDGIYNQSASTLNIYNTIIANSVLNGDCYNNGGTVTGSNNLIETSGTNACGLTNGTNGNVVGFPPNLGTFIGTPGYFPLNVGSPALNAGSDSICAAAPVNTTSQNGVTRPQGSHCDIGSYELTMDASIDINIGGNPIDAYMLAPAQSQISKYALDGGPVVVHSNNGVDIVASLDQWRRLSASDPWTGVAQSMAIPMELITNKYVMPRYVGNDPNLYNAILMANVDGVSRDINVTIGGTAINDTITLGPSESKYLVYNGVVGGPIVVSSANGAKIVASLYELKRGSSNTTYNGQSEMNGLPFSQLSDTYLIPIYFGDPSHIGLDARLFIANADAVSKDITVKIGGVTKGTYTLLPNTSQVLKYPVDGAVEVSSPAGSKIIASLDQWRRLSAVDPWTGVAQSMATPAELITNKYVMPRYVNNDPTLYNAILTANVDTVSRDIHVTIGGTAINDTITLGPSESKYLVYNGVVGGPIVVSSDIGAKIVASLYELKRGSSNTTYNGQSEMNGLPFSQLSDTYLIPIYFGDPSHVGLDARLFIAVP